MQTILFWCRPGASVPRGFKSIYTKIFTTISCLNSWSSDPITFRLTPSLLLIFGSLGDTTLPTLSSKYLAKYITTGKRLFKWTSTFRLYIAVSIESELKKPKLFEECVMYYRNRSLIYTGFVSPTLLFQSVFYRLFLWGFYDGGVARLWHFSLVQEMKNSRMYFRFFKGPRITDWIINQYRYLKRWCFIFHLFSPM